MTTSAGFAEISTHILIENTIAEIKEQYLADTTPWIVGFSGGKDSTTLLQLVSSRCSNCKKKMSNSTKKFTFCATIPWLKIRRLCAGLTTRSTKSERRAKATISRQKSLK